MEFLRLYDKENRDILFSMSWLNKNSIFDKSTGSFEEIDLFTFLENINEFDYAKDTFYDDIYYILEYTKDSILHLINNINKEIKREHKILPISQAREFDKKTIMWLSRQDGRSIREKLKNNKIKTVKRYGNVDTYENRVFKIFLKKLVLVYEVRNDLKNSDITHLFIKIQQWLRSDDAKNIDEYKKIVYNNILLHHPSYSKIFKSYKWLNRLDEKVEIYSNIYPKQIMDILTFTILEKLQFKTTKLVLPNNLEIKYDEFNISFNEEFLPEKIDLANNITKLRIKTIDEVNFNNIINLEQNVIDEQLNLELNKDRTFTIVKDNFKEVFIDLFRLFPIARINGEIVKFPIALKQEIDHKIINANNTKIINLDHELYTLPEILKTYNTNILRYFLEDFKKYFKDRQLNYIIPDYVNIFEFSQVKKSINSYFQNNRNIPKSILAGLEYLFSDKIQKNDTLIYIQKDNNNDLYVTPLLVKFDKALQSVTKGLYLEKHPTKKLLEEHDSLDELNKYFDKDQSLKLLNKFLQNGIKGIKEQEIALYLDKKIIYLKNTINLNKKDRKHQVKKLFHNKNLFQSNTIDIKDSNEKNLHNFEKVLNYEKRGFTLWKEHLPDLSMEIVRDGYFDKFILVNDKTIVVDKKIEIREHFTIPKGINGLPLPLVFDNKKIDYMAYLESQEFPFKENIECKLELIYDYESDELYKLSFIPLDTRYKVIKVKWKKEDTPKFEQLIYPEYPENSILEDDIEDILIKELKCLKKNFKAVNGNRFYDGDYYFLKSSYSKAMFSKYWQNGNTIINSNNNELKQLISDNIDNFTKFHDKLPNDLKNNIYLFLSYIHQDLPVTKETIFIVKEFCKKEHFYGLALGSLKMEWQQHIFENIFKLDKFKQIVILNIALWRDSSNIMKISKDNLIPLLKYIDDNLKHRKQEKKILTMLEFLLAILRTKKLENNKILYPNELITKKLLNTLKDRSNYLAQYQLKSKISFGKIDKPENLQQMPDLLYATIYYLSNEDIENKIVISELKS